jgi:hypothetical protein
LQDSSESAKVQKTVPNIGLAKAGQMCFIELLNKKWGFVIIWAYVLRIPRLRQALFVVRYLKKTKLNKNGLHQI